MEKTASLPMLIETEAEPGFGIYEKVLRHLINNPRHLSQLVDEDADRRLIFYLSTRHHRIAKFFKSLHQNGLTQKDSCRVREIAESIVTFLAYVIPPLSGDIENKHILDVLKPALAFCLPHRAPGLRQLAVILTSCERLLEDLVCGPGQKFVLQWIDASHTSSPDISTLDTWAYRFAELVKRCPTDHGVMREINRYEVSSALRTRLQEEKCTLEADDARQIDRRVQGAASSASQPPQRDDDLINLLQQAELPSYRSLRTVQSNLDTLSSRIGFSLQCIVSSFPCKLCGENLSEVVRSRRHSQSSDYTKARATEELALDVLGSDVGPWKLLLSSLALKHIQSLESKRSPPIKEAMKNLASGELRSTLFGEKHQRARLKVPLASTSCGQDIMILWQVDVEPDERTAQKQVIKIWEVGDDQDLQKAFERVSKLQRNFSLERIRRCLQRTERQNQRQTPATFEDNLSLARVDPKSDRKIDVRALDQQTIEMAQKFYSVTEPLLADWSKSSTAEFPMNLSLEERRVISHISTSTLILGRSGTGKTTCLVFKLVVMYLSSTNADPNQPAKQLLLTRSTHLTEKLRAYTRSLIETLMFRPSEQEGHTTDIAVCANPNALEHGVLDLQNAMYPLVFTFDQLLSLIENTVRAFNRSAISPVDEHPKQLVDFETFSTVYWPRLPSHVTKKLPVALVFAEIMGVIKGSTASRKLLSPLSRSEYLKRSSRLAPTFALDSDRSALYDFYEAYESYKERHSGIDYVDRVIYVLKAIRKDERLRETLSKAFDEIFIDEVQDHRVLDIEMLLDIVKDSRGFHFAGDTAQTISQDSTFRFQDIKSLMYEHFAAASSYTGQSDLAKPKMFELAKNYRSHQGIVEFASFVMKLLWKGFPDTVDKLEPESAQLNGPKPVLFLDCGIEILVSDEAGNVKLTNRPAEFGAEQVVLVRDEKNKEQLHETLGNSVLILTILQAKGMEFNDVILWDFFSRSSYPTALRYWRQLISDDQSSFDTHKHGGICSDLKHLYVAATRARIRFFLIESSESVVRPIIKLLTDDVSKPLIELIRPNHPKFAEKVLELRPDVSSDPVAWCRKGYQLMEAGSYQDARFCFSKGNSHRDETIAMGKIHEQDGHVCDAARDRDGLMRNFELALECYRSVGASDYAVKICLRLSKYEEAAKICVEDKKFQEAAGYYRSSGIYDKASNCFHQGGDFVSAVDVLRQGSYFDEWVSYLSENRDILSSDSFSRHTSFVKLVLKQKKISPDRYKSAIALLGSSKDQENFYREYEMNEEMAELYSKQERYADLFQLRLKIGQFKKALDLALKQRLWDQESAIQEALIERLLDYVWAGRLFEKDDKELLDIMDEARPNTRLSERASQWRAAYQILSQGKSSLETFHSVAKSYLLILRFRVMVGFEDLVTMTENEGIPSSQFDTLIGITQDLVLTASERAWSIVLLAAGVWKNEDPQPHYSLMDWSPIRLQVAKTKNPDLPKMAKEWFLGVTARALKDINIGFLQRLKNKWPTRCTLFLTRGYCSKKRNGEYCEWFHETWSHDDYKSCVQELLNASKTFCSFTAVYYSRTMNEEFQSSFLGTRRRLLEELLRKITYITAYEQISSIILEARNAIFVREQFPAVAISLQELLYQKNTKDWREHDDLCSFLEQLQFAKMMGTNVSLSLSRTLHDRLRANVHKWKLQMIQSVSRLQSDLLDAKEYGFYLDSLFEIIGGSFDPSDFESLHSLLSEFEYIASKMVIKACNKIFVLPQSWVDLYFTSILANSQSPFLTDRLEIQMFINCLYRTAERFCDLIKKLNHNQWLRRLFRVGRAKYAYSLLYQRIAEYLAVSLINTACHTNQKWTDEFFQKILPILQLPHLQYSGLKNLVYKLPKSFEKYQGKDALVLVRRDADVHVPMLNSLQADPRVKKMSFDELLHYCRAFGLPKTAETFSLGSEYTNKVIETVRKLQLRWRKMVYPRILQRRAFLQTLEGQTSESFVRLAKNCNVSIGVSSLLVTDGVQHRLRLRRLQEKLQQHRAAVGKIAEKIDISAEAPEGESIDKALESLQVIEGDLKGAASRLADESLMPAIESPVVGEVWELLEAAERVLAESGKRLKEVEKAVKAMNKSLK